MTFATNTNIMNDTKRTYNSRRYYMANAIRHTPYPGRGNGFWLGLAIMAITLVVFVWNWPQ